MVNDAQYVRTFYGFFSDRNLYDKINNKILEKNLLDKDDLNSYSIEEMLNSKNINIGMVYDDRAYWKKPELNTFVIGMPLSVKRHDNRDSVTFTSYGSIDNYELNKTKYEAEIKKFQELLNINLDEKPELIVMEIFLV